MESNKPIDICNVEQFVNALPAVKVGIFRREMGAGVEKRKEKGEGPPPAAVGNAQAFPFYVDFV